MKTQKAQPVIVRAGAFKNNRGRDVVQSRMRTTSKFSATYVQFERAAVQAPEVFVGPGRIRA